MSETSRRKFMAVAGATAAAGTVALTAGSADAATSTRARAGSATEPVVAYIEDHRSDVLHLMVGDREVVVRDKDLVKRILHAAGGQ